MTGYKTIRYGVLLFLVFTIFSFISVYPIFRNFDNWGVQDWDQHLFYHAVPRASILEYHQFPLWNPYSCGGMVDLANPQSRMLSPTYLFILFFGVVRGIKLEILSHLIIGMIGMFLLARYFRMKIYSATLSAGIFMLSSMYTVNLAPGMTWIMSIAYIPWAFLFYLKGFQDLCFAPVSGFFLALMFFGGGVYPLNITILFLLLYSFLSVVMRKHRLIPAAGVFLVVMASMLLLGAIKFFPVFEFMSDNPRPMDDYSGYSLQSFAHSLLIPDQTFSSIEGLDHTPGFFRGISYALDENGMYIGIIPMVLVIIGAVTNFKRHLLLILLCLVFLWICFGNRIFPDIWEWLRGLPVYRNMRVAQRFRIIFLFSISLLAGLGLQWLVNYFTGIFRGRKPIFRNLSGLLVVILLLDLSLVNYQVWKDAFSIPPPEIEVSTEFYQIADGHSHYAKEGIVNEKSDLRYAAKGWLYPAFLSNIGTINAYESADVPRNAVPIDSKYYRGEAFLSSPQGEAHFIRWSPNRYKIAVNSPKPGYLIINQNYYPGWKISGIDKIIEESKEGLLKVKIQPGESVVEIYYFPATFLIGGIVSLVSFIILGYLMLRRRKGIMV